MPKAFGTTYMMGTGTGVNYEPLRKNTWEVYISGIDTVLSAVNCKPPQTVLTPAEIYHFNERTKFATLPNPSDFEIMVMDVVSPQVVQQLWTWFKQVYDPNTGIMGYASDYKRQGTLLLYDVKAQSVIRTWTCMGLFLTTSPVPDEGFDYSSNEPVHINMKLSCDRCTLDGAGTLTNGSLTQQLNTSRTGV